MSAPRGEARVRLYTEEGVSVLEYALLVALVAMVATGSLLFLGRGSASPAHVVNNVASNVAVANNQGMSGTANSVLTGTAKSVLSGSGTPVAGANGPAVVGANNNLRMGGAGNPVEGTSTDTPVKAWCTSGETGCSDPMLINGQSEVIHFWATGGSGTYSYQLQGSVPPFMIPDWPDHEIIVEPTDCSKDPGTYAVSLVVSDTGGDTGTLNFTLNVAPGSLCQT